MKNKIDEEITTLLKHWVIVKNDLPSKVVIGGIKAGLNNIVQQHVDQEVRKVSLPREISISTNHFKTLLLGIRLGRFFGTALSINKLLTPEDKQS